MENIKHIRQAAKDLDVFVPILVDLQGPKIRVGSIPEPIEIKEYQTIKLKAGEFEKDSDIIPVDYTGIADDVKIGDKILLDDGKVGLEAWENW